MKHAEKARPWGSRLTRGVALAGVTILAALAGAVDGPVAKPGRLPDWRETAALVEMRNMANAEEICAAETMYFVALEALNDGSVFMDSRPWDYFADQGGSFVLRPNEGRFLTNRVNLLTTYLKWGGPYVTYQPGTWQTGTTPYDQGSLLDPWGTPYYFFSALGLLRGDTGMVTQELYGDTLTDRYAILSLGADMALGGGDDLAWEFGGPIYTIALTSLRGDGVDYDGPTTGTATASFRAPAGGSVRLRGMNMGARTADAKLMFNDTEIDTIASWTTREIQFTIPWTLGGQGGELKIQRGAVMRGNPLQVTVYEVPNAARTWARYE